MKTKFLYVFVVSIFMMLSCNGPDEVSVLDDSMPQLVFSPSPIALNDIAAKFSKDIPYGPYTANTFDVFLPDSPTPTPLVIYIHGGGFLGGQKENPYVMMWGGSWDFPSEIRTLLSNQIAFASINYRLLAIEGDKEGVLKSLEDSKRALQYIRHIAQVLNIDKDNIVLCGSSAGGGTAEWIAFSDDMADQANPDAVLRESTRVKGIAVKATQASYDLGRYESDVFKEYNFTWSWYFQQDPGIEPRFKSFYAMDSLNEFNSSRVVAYRKKVDMLALMSADDPEFWALNPQTPVVKPTQASQLNHHSFHARTLKRWADSLGIPNKVSYGYYHEPSGETFVDFMIRKTKE